MSISRIINRNEKGFTIIEILIIVVILAILAALAVPILLRSRATANETSAIGGLKVIADGQTDYFNASSPHTFTSVLEHLATGEGAGGVSFVDVSLGSGIKAGYTFQIIPGPVAANNTILSWHATCWPLEYKVTGIRSFYIDQSGIVRGKDNGGVPGDPLMPALD